MKLHHDAASALVEILLKKAARSSDIHGARFRFSSDGGATFAPCSLFPGPYPDALLSTSFWEWNEAVQFGNVKARGSLGPLSWNLHANGLAAHAGTVRVRAELLTAEGRIETEEAEVALVPSRAVFHEDWNAASLPGGGWNAVDGLSFEGRTPPEAAAVSPGLTGTYEIRVGISSGSFMAVLQKEGEPSQPLSVNVIMALIPEFDHKARKEIPWKAVRLEADSRILIRPHPSTLEHPEKYPFGRISYLKFIPTESGRRSARRLSADAWKGKTLALYFEPYSWAFLYGLSTSAEVRGALTHLRAMGADEIHTQVVRFGSKTQYRGRVGEPHTEGALLGDDGTYSQGPVRMVRTIDVLRESIDACRALGMRHFANAGLTNCYPGTHLEDRISREHPDWRKDGTLRFNRPETVSYAAALMAEFVEWGTDGVSVDCMRYPMHHTEEDLLTLFRAMRDAMAAKAGGRRIPFTARIPAGDVTYFRAFLELAREGTVDCIVPSTLFPRKPLFSLLPYRPFRDAGCRVFGRIDGWKENLKGNDATALLPADIREDVGRFFAEGADGIFVYQADAHWANPFTRTAFHG
jgi:hypothetical protein